MVYRLFVTDEKGRSANVAQPDHSQNGIAAFQFPDNKPFVLVLEHPSVTTYIPFDSEGNMLDIEQGDTRKWQYEPPPSPKPRRKKRRRR